MPWQSLGIRSLIATQIKCWQRAAGSCLLLWCARYCALAICIERHFALNAKQRIAPLDAPAGGRTLRLSGSNCGATGLMPSDSRRCVRALRNDGSCWAPFSPRVLANRHQGREVMRESIERIKTSARTVRHPMSSTVLSVLPQPAKPCLGTIAGRTVCASVGITFIVVCRWRSVWACWATTVVRGDGLDDQRVHWARSPPMREAPVIHNANALALAAFLRDAACLRSPPWHR